MVLKGRELSPFPLRKHMRLAHWLSPFLIWMAWPSPSKGYRPISWSSRPRSLGTATCWGTVSISLWMMSHGRLTRVSAKDNSVIDIDIEGHKATIVASRWAKGHSGSRLGCREALQIDHAACVPKRASICRRPAKEFPHIRSNSRSDEWEVECQRLAFQL